jgi:hypothetical protein
MPLPTQAQVNTAARYTSAVAATAFGILNLQALGITFDQVKTVIEALGSTTNSILSLISAMTALYVAYRGVKSSSPTGQAEAMGANPKALVNAAPNGKAIITIIDPAMATAALEGQRKAS